MAQCDAKAALHGPRRLLRGDIAKEFTSHGDGQLQLSDAVLIRLLGESINILEPSLKHVQRMHDRKIARGGL